MTFDVCLYLTGVDPALFETSAQNVRRVEVMIAEDGATLPDRCNWHERLHGHAAVHGD
jgi:hypothetical protein